MCNGRCRNPIVLQQAAPWSVLLPSARPIAVPAQPCMPAPVLLNGVMAVAAMPSRWQPGSAPRQLSTRFPPSLGRGTPLAALSLQPVAMAERLMLRAGFSHQLPSTFSYGRHWGPHLAAIHPHRAAWRRPATHYRNGSRLSNPTPSGATARVSNSRLVPSPWLPTAVRYPLFALDASTSVLCIFAASLMDV